MRGTLLLALLLLGALALVAAGPVLGSGDCDDDCPPQCGDCLGCVAPAVSASAPALGYGSIASPWIAPARAILPSSSPRSLDHVPLRAIA